MVDYIEQHKDEFGVEPICTTLQFPPSTYYAAKSRLPSARAVRDAVLLLALWIANYRVYGARKLWKAAQRASGRFPRRVDAATRAGLLELLDHAVEQDWTVRDACRLLELGEGRAWRWLSRRDRDELEDKPSGGNPVHGLLDDEVDEVDEVDALFHEWGEVDRSHRKLAHRGSYLGRVWVSPSSVRRVLAGQGLVLKPPPRPGRSQKRPYPDWVEWKPNQI